MVFRQKRRLVHHFKSTLTYFTIRQYEAAKSGIANNARFTPLKQSRPQRNAQKCTKRIQPLFVKKPLYTGFYSRRALLCTACVLKVTNIRCLFLKSATIAGVIFHLLSSFYYHLSAVLNKSGCMPQSGYSSGTNIAFNSSVTLKAI